MGNRMWMIRGDGGKLYDDFRDKQIVGIGWSQLAPLVKPGLSRAQLLALYQEADPLTKLGTARSGASQVWRSKRVIGLLPIRQPTVLIC